MMMFWIASVASFLAMTCPRNDGGAIYVIARNEAIYDDVLDCFGCFVLRNDAPSQ